MQDNEDNVAWGLNVDNHVSDENDEEGCYKEDLVDPLGNKGLTMHLVHYFLL